jgi:hypothetical protein
MRRLRIAILILALAANVSAADGVYLWRIQRGDSGERAVASLVNDSGADALRPLVLMAEVYRDEGKPVVRRTDAAASPALRKLKRPVTLVLRLNRHDNDFSTDTTWRTVVTAELLRARDALRKAGATVDEAQLDFDCPVSRLRDYGDFLRTIRPELGGLRLTVTGMPSWLSSASLPGLLDATDGWTLQVHLTDLPKNSDRLPPLCDTERARKWMMRASELGKNFRLALPTYAYLAHFNAKGKFAFVESEAGLGRIENGSVKRWSPDFDSLATFVRELHAKPPAHLDGIDWFRLPCDDDRQNLTPTAFAKLRRGSAPSPGKIVARTVPASDDNHIIDLFLENIGDLDADTPARLVARAPQPKFNDLRGAIRIEHQKPDTLVVYPAPTRLRSGERRRLGWMRFTDPVTPEFSTFAETLSSDSSR